MKTLGSRINLKVVIIFSLLLLSCVSFSATSGATYLGDLITAVEDFVSDTKKFLVAVTILFFAMTAIRYAANHDSQTFVSTMSSSLFIVALVGVFVKIVVTVGGSTISPEYIQNNTMAKVESVKIVDSKIITADKDYLTN